MQLASRQIFSVMFVAFFFGSSATNVLADDTWDGSSSTSFSTGANWSDNSAPPTSGAGDLTFGSATNYTVLLNQGDNKDVQEVDVFDVTGGASGYNFTRSGAFAYKILGRSKTNGESIVNSSGNLVTFNVPIEQSAQNGASFSDNLWELGTGGGNFNQTVSFASNSKDVIISGGGTANFNAASALANYTGSSAIVYASTGTTVNVNGTVGVSGQNAGMHGIGVSGGTMLLSSTAGGDLIQDSDNTARGTRLQLEGGIFGYTDADSNTRLAEFYRSLTATEDSTVQFGDNTGGGIIAFVDDNTLGGTFENGVRIDMTNWNGTTYTGGGTDQFVFSELENQGVTYNSGNVYQTLTNVFVHLDGELYYGWVVPSPTYSGMIEIVAGNPVVPEPSTYSMGGILLLAIGAFEYRRRVSARQE